MKNQAQLNKTILISSSVIYLIIALLIINEGEFLYQITVGVILGIYIVSLLFFWVAVELIKHHKTAMGWILMGVFFLINLILITQATIDLTTHTRVPWG